MRIVIAVDSFKGCMRSDEAGAIIARALETTASGADIVVLAVADGGEGTTDAVLQAVGGEIHSATVTGPLGGPVAARFGLLVRGATAVFEMASASGIELVPDGRLDPLRTTTFGTGELIRAALATGVQEIIIGVGGSATVDGGAGMAQALGYRLLAVDGAEVERGGAALAVVDRIEPAARLPELRECRFRVACDVTNPLLGAHGSARVFGPQKGASRDTVEMLDRGLANLAEVWTRQGFLTEVDHPGDGAAGGLGAALRAFCGAELISGADLIADLIGFDDVVRGADLLVTGEGRTDAQTASGKLPVVLASRARVAGVPTILLSGAIAGELPELDDLFEARYATVDASVPPAEAIRRGRHNLEAAARELGRRLAAGEI
jgi:glycerate kinase